MALYHKWDVKNGFAYVLQFFSLISDSLGSVDSDREINKEEMVRTSVTASLCWIRQNEKSWRGDPLPLARRGRQTAAMPDVTVTCQRL